MMFAVYHDPSGKLEACALARMSSGSMEIYLANFGCGLGAKSGQFYRIEASSPENALSKYRKQTGK